jgi:L-fuculose-phosphate aldolase
VLELDGTLVDGEIPSSEVPMHLTIYRSTDALAVVHTHSTYATTLGTIVDELPQIHYAIATLGGPIRVADYATFGTASLARNVVAALEGRTGVLLRNHGAITVGHTLDEAYARTLTLEWLCQIYYRARLLGDPAILSLEEIDRVRKEMMVTGYPRRPTEDG